MPRPAGFPSGATDGWHSPNDVVPLVAAKWDPVTGGAQPQRNHVGPWPIWAQTTAQDRWPLGKAKQPAAPKQAGTGWTPPSEPHPNSPSAAATPNDHAAAAAAGSNSKANGMASWACRAVGPCHQCSRQEAKEPYCYPYGSRRLVDCMPLDGIDMSALRNFTDASQPLAGLTDAAAAGGVNKSPMPLDARAAAAINNGGMLGYESCGRDLGATRMSWASFVILDLFMALGALMLLVSRQRLLAGRHRSVLAGRIGTPAGAATSSGSVG